MGREDDEQSRRPSSIYTGVCIYTRVYTRYIIYQVRVTDDPVDVRLVRILYDHIYIITLIRAYRAVMFHGGHGENTYKRP